MKKGGGVVDDFKVMFTRKESTCVARGIMLLVFFAVGIVAGLWTAPGPRTQTHMIYTNIRFPSTDGGDDAGGFTEFVPLPFVHMGSPIYLQGKSRRGPTMRRRRAELRSRRHYRSYAVSSQPPDFSSTPRTSPFVLLLSVSRSSGSE